MKNSVILIFLTLCSIAWSQTFQLPNLKFAYTEYEPFIDAKTMEIHHSKHHQAYVNNLNKAILGTKIEKLTLNTILMQSETMLVDIIIILYFGKY